MDTIKPPQNILQVIATLQSHGYQAVLAGGCVRDSLLGQTPHDWDVATSATPDEVEAIFPRTFAVGREFGIIVVHTEDGDVEVAMFRSDGEYHDGRHPVAVCHSTMEGDASRRDFTINAMMYDPCACRLYDFTGGQADLKAGIVRAVGEPSQRFCEDKLRMLRGVRFASRLGFILETSTREAIRQAATAISCVSQERIASELNRMLTEGNAFGAFSELHATGLLRQILPEVAALDGVEQPPQFHPEGDVLVHTLLLLKFLDETVRRCRQSSGQAGPPRFSEGTLNRATEQELLILAWSALLHDIGKPPTMRVGSDRIHFNGHDIVGSRMAGAILRRLKMPNVICEAVEMLVHYHMFFKDFATMKVAKRRRWLRHELMPLLIELVRFDTLASHGSLVGHHSLVLEAWEEEQGRLLPPRPIVSGDDLIALGLKPGPQFTVILQEIADGVLEERWTTREQALEWVKKEKLP